MRYPIGIQTFAEIRTGNWTYVDKTELIYRLVQESKFYFLGRPRRFGKSLLLSTLDAYFSGEKDLFQGLAISNLEKDWNVWPVLRFDLNIGTYSHVNGVHNSIGSQLASYESAYGIASVDEHLGIRFKRLVEHIASKTGKRVVILVDEYDKPLLESIGNQELQDTFRAELKPFYGVLKSCDQYIRFAMLSGVTKYGHLSIFSDLNNIRDISINPQYASICGITEEEMINVFSSSIQTFAKSENVDFDGMVSQLRTMYDGYRFSRADIKVYNPYSLLNAFADMHLGEYWFNTGTPLYLMKLLKTYNYPLDKLDGVTVSESSLQSVDSEYTDPISVIYQSGYLTINDYDKVSRLYTLGFPNKEVTRGFFDYLLPFYANVLPSASSALINDLYKDVKLGEIDSFLKKIKSILASTPYSPNKNYEFFYQDALFLIFKLLGFFVKSETRVSSGRIDLIIETSDKVYVMEFKYNGTAKDALDQIRENHYLDSFSHDSRKIISVGVNFDPSSHTIDQWIIE